MSDKTTEQEVRNETLKHAALALADLAERNTDDEAEWRTAIAAVREACKVSNENTTTEAPEVVERVAIAICVAYGDEWSDKAETSIGLSAYHPALPSKEDFREMARDAIEAYWKARKEVLG